jgi:murein DD-endopeptidase MepM/ murein hydrolase activator NlpD
MLARLRVLLLGSVALALGVSVLGGAAAPAAPPASAAPSLTAPTAAHPYSDPTWFPLRTPAKVGCAKSGCGTKADHGYFAIDLLGDQGDPVHAAGAGVAHVGGNSGACKSSSETSGGRWVWVDHGGGVVSRYHHLDSIDITDGQRVTPATRIGTMGHSGDVPPCTTNYLHFEVRHGGVTGERVDFGTLRGCAAGRTVSLPQVLGATGWNDPALHPRQRFSTPQLDSRCVTADWTSSPTSPAPAVQRSADAVTVGVPASQATSWAAELQIWRPSLKAWRPVTTAHVRSASSVRLAADETGRRYRVRAAVHGGRGWSAWSAYREAVGAPAAPPVRYLQWKKKSSKTKSYLHYGWSRPRDLGGTIQRYDVTRRCGRTAATLGAWKSTTSPLSKAYKNLRGLKKAKVCEVKVRAVNAAGPGAWSVTRRISR